MPPSLVALAIWFHGPLAQSSFLPRSLCGAHSPLAFHVGSSSVPIEHGIVRGLLHSLAVQLNGLGPLLAGEGFIGLLLHAFQVWGQLHLGAARGREPSQTS